jgi:hypothetical protein
MGLRSTAEIMDTNSFGTCMDARTNMWLGSWESCCISKIARWTLVGGFHACYMLVEGVGLDD